MRFTSLYTSLALPKKFSCFEQIEKQTNAILWVIGDAMQSAACCKSVLHNSLESDEPGTDERCIDQSPSSPAGSGFVMFTFYRQYSSA